MTNNVTSLIKSSKELKACLQIEKSLNDIREQLQNDFVVAIYKQLKDNGYKLLFDNYACKIREFSARNKKITLALGIDVKDSKGANIYFDYYDEENETINHEKFKRGNQRINRIIENAIDNVLERPRRWQTCIRYEYLENKNSKYDFFRFNENCIELKNPAIFKITVKRVSKKIMKYIDGINEYLGEELL
ncbi:MAG: hypothetical protein II331_04440 [Lachnospiraceae bacterium]|nr:hypothetical protein [Lachnospiraceae bacterium]